MRDEAGLFPGLRRLRVPLRQSRLTRPGARPRAVWAVLAWAVLAGLFFMHGVPLSAGCQDGTPMAPVTASAAAVLPAAMPGGVTGAALPAASAAAEARQSAVPAPPSSGVTAEERGWCCAGLCVSRLPRQGSGDAFAADLVGAVCLAIMAALVAHRLTPAPRAARPPGRPGLPLPLFLGVSRT